MDKLIGAIGPASHVIAIIGIVKENPRIAMAAEGAALAKEVYDYVNKLTPVERQNLEWCDAPPQGLSGAAGLNKPLLLGTRNDMNALFTAPPARLVPIQNDFTKLGMQMALRPTELEQEIRGIQSIFGTVSGVVKGPSGLPFAGIAVWLLKEDGSVSLHSTTASDGSFTFSALPGNWVLAAYAKNYRGWSMHIETKAGVRSPWDIRLER